MASLVGTNPGAPSRTQDVAIRLFTTANSRNFASLLQPSFLPKVQERRNRSLCRSIVDSKGNKDGKHLQSILQRPEVSEVNEASDGRFTWLKSWYPVAVEADLPTDRPTPVRLLGNPVVLWKDGSGVWRAFKDVCPHRAASLSEGRVEEGELQCSYHGWRFRGSDGRATIIPQATDEKAVATAVASRRSCADPYPCAVQDGLIWVYPSTTPDAQQESNAVPILSSPKLADGDYVQLTPWFMRDLPYGVDTLLENVLDPSHVPFAHHGLQGNRYKITKMRMNTAEDIDSQKGFSLRSFTLDTAPEDPAHATLDLSYHPPSLIRLDRKAHKGELEIVIHAVPTDPGNSRFIFTALAPRSKVTKAMALLLKLISSSALRWADHMTRNAVLDGDNVFLAAQEEELRARGTAAADCSKTYYMPTSLDHAVAAFRTWFNNHADALPWGPAAKPPPAPATCSRLELLNRYEQHTQHCPSCSAAHRVSDILHQAGTYIATISAAYLAFEIVSRASSHTLIASAVLTTAAAAVAAISANIRSKLEFQDYRRGPIAEHP